MSPKAGMTDAAKTQRPKPRRKRLRPAPVFAAGAVTFALALTLLGWQVAVGKDPSLGHGKQKPKVVHRVVTRVVVRKVYDKPETIYVPASGTGGGYSSGGYSGGGYSGGGYSDGGYSGGSSGTSTASPTPAPAPVYSPPAYSPPPVSSGAS